MTTTTHSTRIVTTPGFRAEAEKHGWDYQFILSAAAKVARPSGPSMVVGDPESGVLCARHRREELAAIKEEATT